ncbi:MAG: hypothetical protein ACT4P0_02160 [Panacagrimonas sp.]
MNGKSRRRAGFASAGTRVLLELLPAVLILLAGCVALLMVQREAMQTRLASASFRAAVALIDQIAVELLAQQGELHAVLLTGVAAPIREGRFSNDDFDARARELLTLPELDAEARRNIQPIRNLIYQWRTETGPARVSIAETSAPQRRNLVTADVRLMGSLQQQLNGLRFEVARPLEVQAARARRLQLLTNRLIVALLLLVPAATLVAASRLKRDLAKPLLDFSGVISEMERGAPVDVPHLHRADEAGTLAEGFERLRQLHAGDQDREWVMTRMDVMTAATLPCQNETEFAEVVLREMCAVLQVHYAIAYRFDERAQALVLCASRGVADPSTIRQQYQLDEEPIGTCLTGRRAVARVLTAGVGKVSTAVVRADTPGILLLPLVAREHNVAVIVLGLQQHLQPRHQKLVDLWRVMVAQSWSALARGLRTRELIAQVEAQARLLSKARSARKA